MENPKLVTKAIGERLREWRRSLEKTQAEMASLLGVNIGVLRKYEIGLNAPGGLILTVACEKGLNVSWLLTGKGPMLVSLVPEQRYSTSDGVLEKLCESLEALRHLDPEKYLVLSRGFILRSVEAGEHAALKRAAVMREELSRATDFQDILTAPMELDDELPAPPSPELGSKT
ncbi:helix-turn-helix domain-containing protein [Acidovorax sp. LjRoot129]|uniref:helix-turn-helix domain-containing protein n=1 Tax=unclassified Acidovorax TaxID=2684926 RepID=UPI003ECE2943